MAGEERKKDKGQEWEEAVGDVGEREREELDIGDRMNWERTRASPGPERPLAFSTIGDKSYQGKASLDSNGGKILPPAETYRAPS